LEFNSARRLAARLSQPKRLKTCINRTLDTKKLSAQARFGAWRQKSRWLRRIYNKSRDDYAFLNLQSDNYYRSGCVSFAIRSFHCRSLIASFSVMRFRTWLVLLTFNALPACPFKISFTQTRRLYDGGPRFSPANRPHTLDSASEDNKLDLSYVRYLLQCERQLRRSK
jgi:hypothetical protein